jgi:hypothetical protein
MIVDAVSRVCVVRSNALHSHLVIPAHPLHMIGVVHTTQSVEEACLRIVAEAKAHTPCILFIPRFELWWNSTSDVLHEALQAILDDLPPSLACILVGARQVLVHLWRPLIRVLCL